MRILISPDKFKGSLDAAQAAQSIRAGFSAVFPHAEYDLSPIADGGEGTGAIFMSISEEKRSGLPHTMRWAGRSPRPTRGFRSAGWP